MHPILFKLGPFPVHSYGFMVALAFLAGIFISLHYARKEGIKRELILDLAVYVIVASIVGARLLYVIGQWDEYRDNLLEIFMLQKGGLVFLGGLFFALLAVAWYAKRKNIPLLRLLDVLSPGTALGYAIGRIGCFLNGCCFGLPSKLPWAMHFPFGSLSYFYFPEERIHPTQLYSAVIMLFVFFIIVFLYRKKAFDGYVFFWSLISYSLYRFAVEFLRYSPMHWLGLTPSQWMAAVAAVAAVYGLHILEKEHYEKK